MNFRNLFFILIFSNFLYASYEEVGIGYIHPYYENRIDHKSLFRLITEIEESLETQLGYNIFDYSSSGKEINLVYLAPSKLQKEISGYKKELDVKKEEISYIKSLLKEQLLDINKKKLLLKSKNREINNSIKALNKYVKKINKEKNISKSKYEKINKEINNRKEEIKNRQASYKKKYLQFQDKISFYNEKIIDEKLAIKKHNRIVEKVEYLSKGTNRLKAVTFGKKEIQTKSYNINGKNVQERTIKNSMKKIEIYGFDTISELKVILAHEIGHLLGLSHIKEKGALMNPILQKNQIQSLTLSKEDINRYDKIFK